MSNLPDRLLDVHQAAELLGLRPATLYDYAFRRVLPTVKVGTGKRGPLRFRQSTLLKLMAKWERPALRPVPGRSED